MQPLHILADDTNLCGEAPLWDFNTQTLCWVDAMGQKVFKLNLPSMQKSIVSTGLPARGLALHQNGGLVIAGRGLHLWRGKSLVPLLGNSGCENLEFNDIIADPVGRIYAGTLNPPGSGGLYRIDLDGTIELLDEGFLCANGFGFSLDEKTLYFTDSRRREIYAYEYEKARGALRNRRLFVRVPDHEGLPDGLSVDAEGYVWSAQWDGSQVVRYDPDGTIERRIAVPARLVTSIMFGGAEFDHLFITSAAYSGNSVPAPDTPLDPANGGRLFSLRTDIRGKREYAAGILMNAY